MTQSAPEALPEKIGPYRVLGFLGRGGMGEVLRGHDDRLDRPVALKRIRPGGVDPERARSRLRREARAVAKLSHPSIVQVYDWVEGAGDDWLVMELIVGRSLSEILGARAAAPRASRQPRPPGGCRVGRRARGRAAAPRSQSGQRDGGGRSRPHRAREDPRLWSGEEIRNRNRGRRLSQAGDQLYSDRPVDRHRDVDVARAGDGLRARPSLRPFLARHLALRNAERRFAVRRHHRHRDPQSRLHGARDTDRSSLPASTGESCEAHRPAPRERPRATAGKCPRGGCRARSADGRKLQRNAFGSCSNAWSARVDTGATPANDTFRRLAFS
ncbi:MAG: protein kinase [Thermoanaerobaculia bacterium]|nr:protein kinase [Thermoanaerobaculia bacterium]